MKKQSLKLFVATLIIATFAVSSAFAQKSLEFEIPFDFQIGKKEMKAGKYKVRKLDGKKYIFKNIETNKSMFILADAQVGDERKIASENIVFNRYGDAYFLREIYTVRGASGHELGRSKAEKRIRRNYQNENPKLAEKKVKPEQVSIKSAQ